MSSTGAEVFFAKWTENKLMLALLIVGFVIALAVALVIICTCVRGCIESGKKHKR